MMLDYIPLIIAAVILLEISNIIKAVYTILIGTNIVFGKS